MIRIRERQRGLGFSVKARSYREFARHQVFSDSAEGLGYGYVVGVQFVREGCRVIALSRNGARSAGGSGRITICLILNDFVSRTDRKAEDLEGFAILQSEGHLAVCQSHFFRSSFFTAGVNLHRLDFSGQSRIVYLDSDRERKFLRVIDIPFRSFNCLGDVQAGRVADIFNLAAVLNRIKIFAGVVFRNFGFLNSILCFFIIYIFRKTGIRDRVGVVLVISDGKIIFTVIILRCGSVQQEGDIPLEVFRARTAAILVAVISPDLGDSD